MDYLDYSQKSALPLRKSYVRGEYISVLTCNRLVDEYNELIDDIDMILRAYDLEKSK